MLLDNFVHSDLHPGNIMVKFYKPTTKSLLRSSWASYFDKPEPEPATVLASPHDRTSAQIVASLRSVSHENEQWLQKLEDLHTEGYRPELVFIDTGLITELNDVNRANFLELFAAIAHFDGYKAGKLMVERSKLPDLVVDEDTFALKMQHLVLSVKSQTFSLAKIRISDVLSDVLKNIRTHHVKLEADFVNTVISVLLLEGIGRQLDPNMDLFKSAIPILRSLGLKMNTAAVKGTLDSSTWLSMAKVCSMPSPRSSLN